MIAHGKAGKTPFTWRLKGWWDSRRHPVDVEAIMGDFARREILNTLESKRERRMSTPRPGCPTPNKAVYKSQASARTARLSKKHKAERMKIYRCPCGAWHMARAEVR